MSRADDHAMTSEPVDVYRVGLGDDLIRLRCYWAARDWQLLRIVLRDIPRRARRKSWWGLWQAEHSSFSRCPRGLTRGQAYRRGYRLAFKIACDNAVREAVYGERP